MFELIIDSPMRNNPVINDLLDRSLHNPIQDFFKNPGKNTRARLVEIGYRLSHKKEPLMLSNEIRDKIKTASEIVEIIHAGSLIVDDIQDGSTIRRNNPTLHLTHGMPIALNAGNYLYFHGLSLVKNLSLPEIDQNQLIVDLLNLMTKAHKGQALDLGTAIDKIDQTHVSSTCLTSMEYKTGTLMALALRLGSAINHTHNLEEDLELGNDTGLLLQMHDDFGNFYSSGERNEKNLEDLKLKRPTWVWAVASKMDKDHYDSFIRAVRSLPEENELNEWVNENNFITFLQAATQEFTFNLMEKWTSQFGNSHPVTIEILKSLVQKLETSYVK